MNDLSVNTNPQKPGDWEEEIDLIELLLELKQHLLAIIGVTLLGAVIAACISLFLITPLYESSAMLYVISKETTLTSLADLQIGSQLTSDYEYIVNSRPVVSQVIDNMGLDYTYNEFIGKLTVTNPTNTRILSLTISDPDPVAAKEIVDSVADAAADYIGDIMELIPPKVIEYGTVADRKSSPSNTRNTLIGALIGFILSCGIITVRFILDDTIKTEEDVAKYLGLGVLASVPLRNTKKTKSSKASKKK